MTKPLGSIVPPRRPFTKALPLLKWARKLLSDERRWTKGVLYTNAKGKVVSRRYARRCCVIGALQLHSTPNAFIDAVKFLPKQRGRAGRHVDFWNDAPSTTHAKLLAGIDRAIEKAKRKDGVA